MKKKSTPIFEGLATFLFGDSKMRPDDLGLKNGRLAPCPASPNCVSSFAEKKKWRVEPFRFDVSPKEVLKRLPPLLSSLGNAKTISQSENYLHVELASKWMGFVDDVEFFMDGNNKALHFRSASRVGHSDFGANRKRIEWIRAQLEKEFGQK